MHCWFFSRMLVDMYSIMVDSVLEGIQHYSRTLSVHKVYTLCFHHNDCLLNTSFHGFNCWVKINKLNFNCNKKRKIIFITKPCSLPVFKQTGPLIANVTKCTKINTQKHHWNDSTSFNTKNCVEIVITQILIFSLSKLWNNWNKVCNSLSKQMSALAVVSEWTHIAHSGPN